MHQLFGDASNVDACPTEAPCRTDGGGFDVVVDGSFQAELGGLLGRSKATRPTTDHDQVVVVGHVGVVRPGSCSRATRLLDGAGEELRIFLSFSQGVITAAYNEKNSVAILSSP